MPGVVTTLTSAKVSGFALHPYLQDYRVVVHVTHHSRVLCSAIADQSPPADAAERSSSWFHISLAAFNLSDAELVRIGVLIGETDEWLDLRQVLLQPVLSVASVGVVEDLIYTNGRREWVSGATYLDAIHARMKDSDIVELLYRDILGRPADPEGLASYVFQLREGIRSLADIRKSLFDSEEYANRPKEASWAPGAIFSQPIAMMFATAGPSTDEDVDQSAEGTRMNEAGMDESISWPSYPERHVPLISPKILGENLEVQLPVDSVLFGTGWHNPEELNGTPFRWMEKAGVIFSPKPDSPCIRLVLSLAAVYGAHEPMVDCYLDNALAETQVEKTVTGFAVIVTPIPLLPRKFTSLRIESRVSGCPVQEDRGTDQRILSLNILGAQITYRTEGLASDG